MSEGEWTPTGERTDLVDRMVPLVLEAFSDRGVFTRGTFLRLLLWSPERIAELRETLTTVARNNPDASFGEVVEATREDHLGYYEVVADAAGLDRLERASLLAAVDKGFDLALAGR